VLTQPKLGTCNLSSEQRKGQMNGDAEDSEILYVCAIKDLIIVVTPCVHQERKKDKRAHLDCASYSRISISMLVSLRPSRMPTPMFMPMLCSNASVAPDRGNLFT
jgi:hypothetical protein